MAQRRCAGCERLVAIGGGEPNVWKFQGPTAGGLTIELADDEEVFCCLECLEDLPEEPTQADIEAIEPIEQEIADDDAGVDFVWGGILAGAVLGAILGYTYEDTGFWLTFGLAVGLAGGLIVGRIVEWRASDGSA